METRARTETSNHERAPPRASLTRRLLLPAAAAQERLAGVVSSSDDVASAAPRALSGSAPNLVVADDGTPGAENTSDAKQLVERALCCVLHELVVDAGEARAPFMEYAGREEGGKKKASSASSASLPRLLDLSLTLSEWGVCDHGVVFTVLEQLVECCTIADAQDVFTWIEGKRTRLNADVLWRRGKLIMLRTCNDLLRRLSKTNDATLRGRVLLLLSSLYALSERSALNLAGNYNRANVTTLDELEVGTNGAGKGKGDDDKNMDEDAMETDDAARTNAPVVDVRFYKTFWSLQTFFQNPNVALGVAGGWDAFYAAFQAVLDNFETHRLDASDETAATTAEESALGVKYLTAAPLLQLQLRDPAFRRSFLLQCAILLGHCEGPPALPKVKRDQVAKAKARVMAATAATPPNARGVEFAEFVAAALKREVYWV